MKIYKVQLGTLDAPVRNGAHKNANIIDTLNGEDKVFSNNETDDYVQIKEIEMPKYGTDLSMRGGWICKVWLDYRGLKD